MLLLAVKNNRAHIHYLRQLLSQFEFKLQKKHMAPNNNKQVSKKINGSRTLEKDIQYVS